MAMDNTRVIETIRSNARKISEAQAKQCSGPACPESLAGLTHARGSRVLDTVSGKEGVILVGSATNAQI